LIVKPENEFILNLYNSIKNANEPFEGTLASYSFDKEV